MSEIEKMMQNAGVKPEINYVCDKEPCEQHSVDCQKCSHLYDTREDYPDFTAEKQLKLIKWLILNDFIDKLDIFYRPFELMWVFKIYNVPEFANEKSACRMGADMTFEKGLASLINNLWQDLTEEEKASIKIYLKCKYI